jgi:hypothetical protein
MVIPGHIIIIVVVVVPQPFQLCAEPLALDIK